MSAIVQARDLAVGYRSRRGATTLLSGVNVTSARGQLVCLLGANGAGKSTLLRTLAGLQPGLAGSISLAGDDLHAMTAHEISRRLAVVLTERLRIDDMPVRKIVELGRYPHANWFGALTPRDHTLTDWALQTTGAMHLAPCDFDRLSDGERQRVMIARALAQAPQVLVLDEPTAFLDVTSRIEIWALLQQLAGERGLSVIVATHDLELALSIAHHAWLITAERAVIAGAPDDLVASGAIARTFARGNVRFDPDQRRFSCGQSH